MERIKLLPFTYKKLENKYLLVNDVGEYFFLTTKQFDDLVNKRSRNINLKGKLYYQNEEELTSFISRYRKNKFYLNNSTSLFILVLTNRCILNCVYCQASKINCPDKKYDMTLVTAKKAVELILQSPTGNITIEFQGGEPLLNFDILSYIVEYLNKYAKLFNKTIQYNIVSNLIPLDNKKLDFLIKNKVSLCTSLDGNKLVQNFNRPADFGDSLELLITKINMIKKSYPSNRLHLNAIQTTTRISLGYSKEIVDEYRKLGFHSIFLRYLNPFGLAKPRLEEIGYSPYEFLKFYKKTLDYIISINLKGERFIEGTTQIFLRKIFGSSRYQFMDIRSPCGASIGQMAFNHDGKVYTCDEGRMVAEVGDLSFCVGDLNNNSYSDLIKSDVTKKVVFASCSECFQRCHQCVYRSYCGVCPIINYVQEGSMLKNNGFRCTINNGILDIIFDYLKKDSKVTNLFKNWIN